MNERRLPRVLGTGRRAALGALVLDGLGQAGLAVLSGLAVGAAFTALRHPAPPTGHVLLLAAAVAACGLGVAGLRAAEKVLAERVGQSYVHDLRMRLLDQVLAAPPREQAQRSTGGTALRFTSDLSAFRRWVSLGLARLVVAIPLLAGVLAFLTFLAWPLALGTTLGVGAGVTAYALLSAGLRRSSRSARKLRGKLASEVTERIAQLPAIAANGAQPRERRRVRRRSTALYRAELRRSGHIGAMRAAAESSAGLAIALCVVSAALSGVAPADIATALVVLTVVLTPLRDLGRVHEYRATYHVARDRVTEVLARPRRPGRQNLSLASGPGRVRFDGVSVAGILREVSLTAEPGRVIAVHGANGAGKSTLIQLLCGLITPESGSVTLDGVEPSRLHPKQLRTAVGVVGPDFPLLRGSVDRNLRYRVPDAEPDELARVRALVGLDEVLAGLGNRERTRLGDRGAGLSSGQQARLALGRALVGGPRLLLLDEADAHLDTETINVLRKAVASFDGTVVCVSHSREIAAHADVTWQVSGGAVHVWPGSAARGEGRSGETTQESAEETTARHAPVPSR